ncbi:unnamed protein product [Phytophthora fragariaefolia]|uniref:Unnamed protein product n=1 Tax=Phytophthora fragariaefolia TaxID=1490495 RepID=A0A9W6WIG3_9STRA|nr:unnamed protein product [Phytophthora fragariaefolia]
MSETQLSDQINGSEGFASPRDAYIMLPYKVSMKNGATAQTAAANRLCTTRKCGNWNVIDSLSLELNGMTFRYHTVLPQARLMEMATLTTLRSRLPSPSRPPPGGASIPNDGFVKRLLSNPPTAGSDFTSSWPSVGGTAASTTISNQTSRGAFVVGAATANAIMGTSNHMLKIKLTDLHPIFREIDLMSNPQIRLRFRVNQGTSVIAVDATKGMSLTSTTLSSGNSCSVTIASSSTGNPMASVLAASAGFRVSGEL